MVSNVKVIWDVQTNAIHRLTHLNASKKPHLFRRLSLGSPAAKLGPWSGGHLTKRHNKGLGRNDWKKNLQTKYIAVSQKCCSEVHLDTMQIQCT